MDDEDIIISGRSIGSGPACHLASKFNPSSLLLISPIRSVKDVARLRYGRIVDLLIEERFDNFTASKSVACPTLIFHGMMDSMVPYQQSIEMLLEGFVNARAHMFLRDQMEHNRFNYDSDIIKPLKYFLKTHNIRIRPSKFKEPIEAKLLKNVGYVDKKAVRNAKLFGFKYKSLYLNNF